MRIRVARNFLYSFFLTLTLFPSLSRADDRGWLQILKIASVNPENPETISPSLPGEDPDGRYIPDRRCNLGFTPLSTITNLNQQTPMQDIVLRQDDPSQPNPEEKTSSPADQPERIVEMTPAGYPDDLEQRLERCPILRDHIFWEAADGRRVPYPEWEPEQKQRLNDLFYKLIRGEADLGLQCPDPSSARARSQLRMYLSAEQGFDVFAAHVAHVLFVEARRLVPWSVTQDSDGELDQLLASYNYQSIIRPSREYNYPEQIRPGRDFQQTTAADGTVALLCDPRVGYRFLRGSSPDHRFQRDNLVAGDAEQTMVNLTYYFRKNVAHGGGESLEQLLGRSLLKDRLRLGPSSMIWASAGCHGAAQLFQDLARSINIPLLNIGTQENPDTRGGYPSRTHRGLIYDWESPRARILWHADEIYAIAYTDPVFPVDEGGTPLSLEASKRLFFERYWPSPRTLQAWGFQYHPEIVIPGRGFGVNDRGAYEDYADLGWMGGHWLPSDRTAAFLATGRPWDEMSIQMYGDLVYQYNLENLYQMCGWDLISNYAQYGNDGRSALESYITNKFGGRSRTGLSVRQLRSPDEYWNRAVACVDAHGGPERVRELHAQWESNRGYHVSFASTEAVTTIDPSVWEAVR